MKTKILTCLGIFVTVIAFGIYWFFVGEMKFFNFSNAGSDWANFGSYAGGIFAALAFLVVVHQNYERDKEQRKQDFERTFFMMSEHHNNKLRFLEDKNSGVFYKEMNISFVDYIYQVINEKQRSFSSIRQFIDKECYKEYSELNSYFLNLFRILKFINKNSKFNEGNEYSSLLRSFISKKMLVILACHLCGRDYTYNDYISYINKFNFFEHMDIQNFEIDFLESEFQNSYLFNRGKFNFKMFNLKLDINKYNDVKSFFSCVLEYNELKENYLESKVIKLVSCKRTFGSVTKNLFIDNYKINKYTQVHLFIYFITIFDNAFNGNVEYKYIKNLYKEFAKELNDSPLLENKK